MPSHAASTPTDYFDLVRRFPLAPIRTRTQLRRAYAIIDELAVIDEEKMTSGRADYLLVLSDLVEKYEDAHLPRQAAFVDGVDALQYLMSQSGMSASDLGRLLGSRQLGSALLRRQRELSKSHIVKLARHFKVSTDLFLVPGATNLRRAS